MSIQPYIRPSSTTPLPGSLTLNQFIQTVLVGLTGVTGTRVRPKWQIEPPKQPDLAINWIAFGVEVSVPDANGYVDQNEDEQTISLRHETLEIAVSIYGPDSMDNYGLLRDGFQIQQNIQALWQANMGFVEIAPARHVPDFLAERFYDRYVTSIFIRRQIQRVYSIPTLLSANGTIYVEQGYGEYLLDWETQT